MIAQILRWLIFAALLAAVLVAVFIAWWLALLIVFVALAIGAARRLFSSNPPEQTRNDPVILEGEYIEVERETEPEPDNRDSHGP
ncbi:MAG: hypothetical protein LBE33_01575 [Zoogloeaceae bacterium]|jgi:membrane protein implicated in regulation of membrane protease activity|nr:hypothetical protein [Zoogloeaceae bacterium]